MSWQQLLDINKANKQEWEDLMRQSPYFCPKCGYPLQSRNGVYDCPLGDWTWPIGILSIRSGGI